MYKRFARSLLNIRSGIFRGDMIFLRENILVMSDKSWPAKEEGTIKDNAVIE